MEFDRRIDKKFGPLNNYTNYRNLK